jgi:D-arabinose 1-dehydrogenase-like Zn-dependent alcohol dehydrogenase
MAQAEASTHYFYNKRIGMENYLIESFGQTLRYAKLETPRPTGTQVLLEVQACGVCHTDLHVWHGGYDLGGGRFLKMSDRGLKLPHTLGHETVGRVAAVGDQVKDLAVNGHYLVYPWIGCGECVNCRDEHENLCTNTPRYMGIFSPGGYSSHVLVPHPKYLVDIGHLDPKQVAPMACAGLTTYSAINKVGARIHDKPLVIIGAGGLGLMALGILSALGGKGVVLDVDANKRAAALKAGALAALDANAPDINAQILAAVGAAPDAVIDFVGAPATVQLGCAVLAKGGRCIVVGLVGGEVTLSIPPIALRAISLEGSFVGTLEEMRQLMALVKAGKIPELPIVARPLSSAAETLSELEAGKLIGRAVLVPAE